MERPLDMASTYKEIQNACLQYHSGYSILNCSTDDSSASHFTDSDFYNIWLPQRQKTNPISLKVFSKIQMVIFLKKPNQLLFIRFVKLQTADSVPFVVLLYKINHFLIILNIN
jgi:hypothetical protein